MTMDSSIPVPDVLPVPAPVWLVQFLLVSTFFLHLVPMNLLFGGGILAAVSHIRSARDPHHAWLAKRISELMPVAISFAVTLGVAPLLFVQVLYGHLLYSSSILMANAWFLVVPLVIVGYYGAYLLRFRWEKLGGRRTPVAWGLAVLFAGVGFIYSNNFTLMLQPDTWAAHYFENPSGGQLNWSDPSLYPRYLHMLIGAVAVAGVWILILGVRRRSQDTEWSKWACRYGGRLFIHATSLNIIVGFWFMLSVPRRALLIFMGRDAVATGAFIGSLACLVAAFIFVGKASRRQDWRAGLLGTGFLLAVLALMAVMRHQMRTAYLEPHFRLDQLQVEPQWGVFALFAVILLVGLGFVGWLVSVVLRAKPAE
jgi:hypothetical protein